MVEVTAQSGEGAHAGDEQLIAVSLLTSSHGIAEQLQTGFGVDGCVLWLRTAGAIKRFDQAGECERLLDLANSPLLDAQQFISGDGRNIMVALTHSGDIVGRIGLSGRTALPLDHKRWRARLDGLCQRLSQEAVWRITHERLLVEHERMQQTAMIDSVTGAWTKAAFDGNVVLAISSASRRRENLALLNFDIVGLEAINVRLGHQAGDAVLAHVASILRANIRSTDELGRIAGDEISVLLANATPEAAMVVADKLAHRIIDRTIRVADQTIEIQVRVGVTVFGPNEKNAELAHARTAWAVARMREQAGTMVLFAPWDVSGVHLSPSSDDGLASGTTLGGAYRVIHELSRGATGVVYRGEDLVLGRQVAIKVLRSDLAADPQRVARFRTEAASLATLRHPNLVGVHAAGIESDRVYFVMELIEGATLWDILRGQYEKPNHNKVVELHSIGVMVQEISDALVTLHGAGLIHRDVKPENIIIERVTGRAVLVDVGTAKRYGDRQHGAGTPGFSAPESFANEPETFATDVYGLAATAYTMIAGAPPFGFGEPYALLAKQAEGLPPPPSSRRHGLQPAVDEVILRGLAMKPSERFKSPAAFAVALASAMSRTTQRQTNEPPIASRGFITIIPEGVQTEAGDVVADDPCGMVRGSAIRVAVQVIGIRKGEWWLRRLAEEDSDLGKLVRPDLPPMSWQPAFHLGHMIEQSGGDAIEIGRTVGLGMAANTFAHVWGADPHESTATQVLEQAPGYWARYFTAGSVEVEAMTDVSAEMIVSGPPAVPAMRGLISGALQRIVELTGANEVDVQATHVVGDDWRFAVKWANPPRDELEVMVIIDDGSSSTGDDSIMR